MVTKTPPEKPPEPTQSEVIQAEVVRIKKLLGLDINRLAIGSDIEGIITGGPFGAIDFTTTGINTISFVNVSTSIGPSQTNAPGVPAQVTGLVVTPISNSQLNLAWTASGSPNIANYKVYRNSSPIASPVPNSYSDTGLLSGTTYAYNVSAFNSLGLEGPLSTTVNGTTTGSPPPISPSLELHLDSSFVDTSPNGFAPGGINNNGFILPGAFGTAGWKCNSPSGQIDFIVPYSPAPAPAPLQMDTSVGFSISLWLNPQDLSALSFRRGIIDSRLDASNVWSITIDSSGIAYFNVQKAGTDYKAQVSGFTTGSWQHLGATFNGATNTPIIYRNAVAGISSSAATQYKTNDPSWYYMSIGYTIGAGTGNSHYVGYYDEIRYYKSVVLTPTQITNLKNTNAP
jgi:hypothetical protein